MRQQLQPASVDPRQLLIAPLGAGEWIVTVPVGGRSLHVYELGASDWLVSEVARGSEGRGTDLKQALQALSTGAAAPEWWAAVPQALDEKNSKVSRPGA